MEHGSGFAARRRWETPWLGLYAGGVGVVLGHLAISQWLQIDQKVGYWGIVGGEDQGSSAGFPIATFGVFDSIGLFAIEIATTAQATIDKSSQSGGERLGCR